MWVFELGDSDEFELNFIDLEQGEVVSQSESNEFEDISNYGFMLGL